MITVVTSVEAPRKDPQTEAPKSQLTTKTNYV